jgi:predicted type IV restriction endonuclease
MTEDVTKRVQVTFSVGLPLGHSARFTHNGELWIAYPAPKQKAIKALIDRLIGNLAHIQDQMIHWLSAKPDDADRVAMLLKAIASADTMRREVIADKGKAVTA